MATVEELVQQALARATEFGNNFPATRSILYRRLGVRQQQLYALAARVNPDYFGDSAIGTLDANGAINIDLTGDPDAGDPVENMELISRIEIEDEGVSSYTAGQEVNVIQLTDEADAVAFPPRVTIRGKIIRQVGTDLADVISIRVYYSKRPFRVDPTDGGVTVQLPEPFHDLLVVDLAKYLVRKIVDIKPETRTVALDALDAEEKESLANFVDHVLEFTSASEKARFGRSQGATKQ